MKRSIGVIGVLIVLACFVYAQDKKEWVGIYAFDENGGKTAGGSVIYISHELNVFEADDGLRASLQSNGYQTSKDLNCTVKLSGSKLEVYFESYGENNMFETFEPGDLLLTLERRTLKGKSDLLTFWGKFTPSIEKNEKTGKVYFAKSTKIDTN